MGTTFKFCILNSNGLRLKQTVYCRVWSLIVTVSCFYEWTLIRIQAVLNKSAVCLQVDGRVSYGNDALMPDQTYSSAPLDPGLDGLGFIHPESFNQPNTENHGNTHF